MINEKPHHRLRKLRKAAGHKSAASFARTFSVHDATYRSHENGSRTITIETAKQYAALLKAQWKYILFGDDPDLSLYGEFSLLMQQVNEQLGKDAVLRELRALRAKYPEAVQRLEAHEDDQSLAAGIPPEAS